MTTDEQQYDASVKEALSAQRNEHANKEAHWFAMYMVEKDKNNALEAKVKELTPKEPVKLEAVE